MIKPLISWEDKQDDDLELPEGVVFSATLDDRFGVEAWAWRPGDHKAKLYIFDHDNNDELIQEWDVSLDVGDLDEWQDLVEEFIDSEFGSDEE